MASSNNRLRQPICLHRQTRTPVFAGGLKLMVYRPGTQRTQVVRVR